MMIMIYNMIFSCDAGSTGRDLKYSLAGGYRMTYDDDPGECGSFLCPLLHDSFGDVANVPDLELGLIPAGSGGSGHPPDDSPNDYDSPHSPHDYDSPDDDRLLREVSVDSTDTSNV